MFGAPLDWVNGPKRDEDEEKGTYYEVELTPRLRRALLNLLRDKKVPDATKKLLETQVMVAREVNLPLPAGTLNWAEIEEEAERQGVGVLDVWFDRIGAKT